MFVKFVWFNPSSDQENEHNIIASFTLVIWVCSEYRRQWQEHMQWLIRRNIIFPLIIADVLMFLGWETFL